MCGIAGIVSDADERTRIAHVNAMLDKLVHRGPDEHGLATLAGVSIGARRLSIIDVAGGHQPTYSEDGSVTAVQNGEIYNFPALRAELLASGHHFVSRGDTEVLVHAYEEFGVDLVSRLRGMFALAIWDGRQHCLVLARDRLGKKPLFYAVRGQELMFCSEIQGLLAAGVDRAVDDTAIAEYLTYGYIPAPRTGFASIRKLEPAHVLTYKDGRVSTTCYWTPSFEPKNELRFDEAAEAFLGLLDEATRIRLISDVPLGVLLSGGLDSSTIVALAARHSDRPLRTFSVGFTEADFSELRFARLVADRFGTEHHEFIVDPSAVDVLPTLVRHFGEPFADSSAIPTYYVAHLARQHVTVALNGDGGDELLAGYDRYRAVALAGIFDRAPAAAWTLSTLSAIVPKRSLGPVVTTRVRRLLEALSLAPDERYLRWIGYFEGPRNAGVYRPRIERLRPSSGEYLARAAASARASETVERAMAADLLTYLPGDLLVKMDIATMANSLEARSPFLDHELVEFVSALPRSYKMSLWSSKRLLRRAVRDILPRSILSRGKMGFVVPVGRWLRGPLRELLEDALLATDALSRDHVDPAAARALVRDHLAGTDRTPHVWALLMLELWFRYCVRPTERRQAPIGPPPYVLGRVG